MEGQDTAVPAHSSRTSPTVKTVGTRNCKHRPGREQRGETNQGLTSDPPCSCLHFPISINQRGLSQEVGRLCDLSTVYRYYQLTWCFPLLKSGIAISPEPRHQLSRVSHEHILPDTHTGKNIPQYLLMLPSPLLTSQIDFQIELFKLFTNPEWSCFAFTQVLRRAERCMRWENKEKEEEEEVESEIAPNIWHSWLVNPPVPAGTKTRPRTNLPAQSSDDIDNEEGETNYFKEIKESLTIIGAISIRSSRN